MDSHGNPYEEVDEVPDRQPHCCPYCGAQKGFDGQGKTGKFGYQHRCPDCGGVFITLDPEAWNQ
jgi:ribosomal protein S27AE